jgi:hypothetical protein
LARLPIPTFNNLDPQHAGLANLGRQATTIIANLTADPFAITQCEAEIDDLVWAMASET